MKKRLFIGIVAIVVIIVCFSLISIFSPQIQGKRACEKILHAYKYNEVQPYIEYDNIDYLLRNTTIKDYKFDSIGYSRNGTKNVYHYKVLIDNKESGKEIIIVYFGVNKHNIFSYRVTTANTGYLPTAKIKKEVDWVTGK
jgi:predicted small secreted protein